LTPPKVATLSTARLPVFNGKLTFSAPPVKFSPTHKPQEKVYTSTQELCMPGRVSYYKQKGLVYLRRRPQTFIESLRNPTLGCYVELLRHQEPDTYHIDSYRARCMIRKVCY
jgi:hypothetical protein